MKPPVNVSVNGSTLPPGGLLILVSGPRRETNLVSHRSSGEILCRKCLVQVVRLSDLTSTVRNKQRPYLPGGRRVLDLIPGPKKEDHTLCCSPSVWSILHAFWDYNERIDPYQLSTETQSVASFVEQVSTNPSRFHWTSNLHKTRKPPGKCNTLSPKGREVINFGPRSNNRFIAR